MASSPDEIKHARITTFIPTASGAVEIETKSYHEQLKNTKTEIMQHFVTSRSTFLSDLIASVDVISNKQTHEVTLTITTDEHYMPKLITRTHVTKKESFHNH